MSKPKSPELNQPVHPADLLRRELQLIDETAHKLVDQLTAVLGYAELALERRRQKQGVCDELQKIQNAANKAIAMVRLTVAQVKTMKEANS